MRSIITASIGVLALAAASGTAFASSHVYPSEAGAQATCPQTEVVWMDLGKNMYFHKSQSEFGKTGGAFACVTAARDRGFRESKPVIQEASKPE